VAGRVGSRLTLIEAIWQYTAGVSLDLPTVKKNKLRRLKTSAKIVSTRLGSGGAGPLEVLLEEAFWDNDDC